MSIIPTSGQTHPAVLFFLNAGEFPVFCHRLNITKIELVTKGDEREKERDGLKSVCFLPPWTSG